MLFDYDFAECTLSFGETDVTVRSARSFTPLDGAPLPDEMMRVHALPVGSSVWPSSIALASTLGNHPEQVRGKTVLELGCGAGLCSIVAQQLGGQVLATDMHPDMGALVRMNAELNGVEVAYSPLDWRDPSASPGQFDVVMASDVLYEPQQCNVVLDVLERTMTPGGEALVVDPGRPHLPRFLQKLENRGLRVRQTRTRVDRSSHPGACAVLDGHPAGSGEFQVLWIERPAA